MATKVVAFRVTQNEYDALAFTAQKRGLKLSDFVKNCLHMDIDQSCEAYAKEQKRIEAKAKRDAKKAATNVAI